MIKIIQNDSVINHKIDTNSVIITSPQEQIKYKRKFANKDVFITTLDLFIRKYQIRKTPSNKEAFILMSKAYKNVRNKLIRYDDVEDFSFYNMLCLTYKTFKENKLIDNDKSHDLNIIYNEYEALVNKSFLINEYDMYEYLINNLFMIKEDVIYFENLRNLSSYEIKLIKALGKEKDVVIYANTINNPTFISKLNLLDKIDYQKTNTDVDYLYDIEAKDLFKDVLITECNDLYEEVKYLSLDIKDKINSGLKLSDILIVSPDIKRYKNYFELEFSFPYEKENEEGVLTNRFINLLNNIIQKDFSCFTFVNLLKLGIFKVDDEMVDKIDNYVYTWNLQDEPFYNEFTFKSSILDKLNEIRLSILNPIKYLLENVINETDKNEILKYLFTYMDEEEISVSLSKKDPLGYDDLVSDMEVLSDFLDKTSISEVLSYLCALSKVKTVKNKLVNQVNVQSLDEYFYDDYKFVYFIGLTQEDVPRKFTYNTLINNNDLPKEEVYRLIKENESDEQNLISNVLLNKNVMISYHKLTDEASIVDKSILLSKFYQKPLVFSFELEKEEEKTFNKTLDKKVVDLLYNNYLVLSPSSLEVFAKCPYSFFLSYGLKLKIKEKKIFDNRSVGTFVHYLLENCLNKDNYEEYCNIYTEKYINDNFMKFDNTTKYVINYLKESTIILIDQIKQELSNNKFKPVKEEFEIKNTPLKIDLKNGVLKVIGIIDRVDAYCDGNNCYYRIIDYKTGSKKFRLDDVLIGQNMQMLIYLLAIKNICLNKNMIPTGFLYAPALVHYQKESLALSENEIIKNIHSNFKMNGIVSSDSLDLYNDNIGDFIDVTSRGKITDEKVFTKTELDIMFDKVIKIIKDNAESILDGNIKIDPIIDNKNDSCKYCKYEVICKFNKLKDKPRRYKSISNKDALKMIEGDKSGMD